MRARLLNLFFLCIILTLFFPELGYTQEEIANYPTRPITFIILVPPGSSGDLACRSVAQGAEKYLKQPLVPVNKSGGGLTIGTAAIAKAKPDGYTIGHSAQSPLFVAPYLETVPYHPVKDLKPIIQFGTFNFGMVVKQDSPFKDFREVIAYSRQNPKKPITYGCAPNSISYLIMQQIAKKENVQLTLLPFKGTSEAEMALLGGHLDLAIADFSYSLIEAGQTRLLLLFREERSAEYPQTPILKDLGYDIPCPMFIGIQGPKDLPEAIVKKLEEAFTEAMKEETFIKGMKSVNYSILHRNSKELGEYVSRNYDAVGKMIKAMGLGK
jgi:tripartite-type tricarboxylate transporter receptor subunit TctC